MSHSHLISLFSFSSFFFHPTPTTEIYTLSLHDALPISAGMHSSTIENAPASCAALASVCKRTDAKAADRKSTRLNSSHLGISYAVFCLKKKKKKKHVKNRTRNIQDWKTHKKEHTPQYRQ